MHAKKNKNKNENKTERKKKHDLYKPDTPYILELVSPDPWVIELGALGSKIS